MSGTLIVILISVGAVGLFVLGMSLTLMIKGHHIDSEIADNKNMQRLGIKCAAQQGREDARLGDGCDLPQECAPAGCASCVSEEEKQA